MSAAPAAAPVATGQVLHYSSSGVFLNVLGANDATRAPLYPRARSAFGPNGNLYVADLEPAPSTSSTLRRPRSNIWPADTLPSSRKRICARRLCFRRRCHPRPDRGRLSIAERFMQCQRRQLYDAHAPRTPVTGIIPFAMLDPSDGDLLIADSIPATTPPTITRS